MKKVLPLTLMAWPYLFVLFVLLPGDMSQEVYFTLFLVYLVLTILIYILNIRNAFTYAGENAPRKLAFFDMMLKLVHIPFYFCVFLVGAIFLLAMVVPAFVLISPLIVVTLFVVDGLLMLTTSMYGISAAVKAAKSGMLSRRTAILNGLLHCLFVADVISAIVLYRKIKNSEQIMR